MKKREEVKVSKQNAPLRKSESTSQSRRGTTKETEATSVEEKKSREDSLGRAEPKQHNMYQNDQKQKNKTRMKKNY